MTSSANARRCFSFCGPAAHLRQTAHRVCLLGLALLGGIAGASAAPVISEFMASNKTTLADDDGAFSDWVELYNPDASAVSLDGWYLTDNAAKKTKWKFPAVTIPAGGRLVVFASDKNRRDPAQTLHTSFSLSADGEYLGLIQPDGVTVASEFAPKFPAQLADISYGRTEPTDISELPQTGYFVAATPGAANGGANALAIPQTVAFSRPSGLFLSASSVTLTGAADGQTIRYVTANASASGADVPDPTATSDAYTAPIPLTSSVIVKAAVFSADGSRHGLVTRAQYVALDASSSQRLDTFTSRLPVVVIDNHGYGPVEKDGLDRPAWFYAFRPATDGTTHLTATADHIAPLSFAVRGSTSALFPKKSFKFDLLDNLGQESPQALFGLPAFVDWNLIGPWGYDRSYIRNAVTYELSRRMGHWAPRTQFVELFYNNNGGNLDASDYAGIYFLTDKIEIDPGRVAITKLSASDTAADTITGGYLMRADEPDAEKYSWITTRNNPEGDGSVLLVEEPKLAKLAPAQGAYLQDYVQQMEDALYTDAASRWTTRRYLDYLDRPSWVDYHLLNVLVKNTDAFWRSAYFSKDRGGKLFAGPVWDYDRSMDSTDPRDDDPETWSLTLYTSQGFAVQYWETGWWGVLARDPDFMQAWIDRWLTLRRDTFAETNLNAIVTGFANQIGPDAAARDAARWPDNLSTHGSFTAETEHLVNWLVRRANWIDRQFVAASTLRTRGSLLTVTPPAGLQFAYTRDGTDPRASGGGLAPGAVLSDIPLAFSDFENLRVRTYDPSMVGAFPGSPWSLLQTPAEKVIGDKPTSSDLPRFTLGGQGGAVTAYIGTATSLQIQVTGSGPFTYQWYFNGTALAGATSATLALDRPTATQTGSYTVEVTNPFGSATSAPFVVTVLPATRLVNISARGEVGTGDDVLIAGFVLTGSGNKNFLARAVGPGLIPYGIDTPVTTPLLRVLATDGSVLASNQNWSANTDAAKITTAATQVGAFPLTPGSHDAALLAQLPAGIYTLHATPGDNVGRIGLLELYALDETSYPVNLSTRGHVRSGDRVLIGGFVIAGTGKQRVLLRAVGPSLAGYGVNAPLADPVLELTQEGRSVARNDDWTDSTDLRTTSAQVGAFSLLDGSKDAVLLVDLPAGVYSALVSGKGAADGIALLEIYAVP